LRLWSCFVPSPPQTSIANLLPFLFINPAEVHIALRDFEVLALGAQRTCISLHVAIDDRHLAPIGHF
jgi:hypothetical protein